MMDTHTLYNLCLRLAEEVVLSQVIQYKKLDD